MPNSVSAGHVVPGVGHVVPQGDAVLLLAVVAVVGLGVGPVACTRSRTFRKLINYKKKYHAV